MNTAILGLLLAVTATSLAEESSTDAVAACQKEIQAKLEQSKEEYLQGLNTIAQRLQTQGALESLLVVRAERMRFKSEGNVEAKHLARECPLLRDWQAKFIEYQAQIPRSISSSWVAKLEQQKVQLTKTGKIEEAIGIKSSIELLRDAYSLDETASNANKLSTVCAPTTVATNRTVHTTNIQKTTSPSRSGAWTNSLGMIFVPVTGTKVLFSIWDTRVQDYQTFVSATGQKWPKPRFKQGQTHPAVDVSWNDAKAFCAWLTKKELSAGLLQPGQEYRLPTDAEWSVAVGLGAEVGRSPADKDGKIKGVYLWGRQWPPPRGAGNYAGEESKAVSASNWRVISGYDDGFTRTSPVGNFFANQFGLYDMGGNVWQWCEDEYKPGSGWRVLRGSSWGSGISDRLLSSYRLGSRPDLSNDGYGFRCVLVSGSSPLR